MVDFRYHLVSIIAVFLALAIGIVLGTTFINGPLFDTLNNRVTSLTKDRDALRSGNDKLTERVAGQSTFEKAVLPFAVGGRLLNERIVIVSAADADKDLRDAAAQVLQAAGATVVGRVSLTEKFADPGQSEALDAATRRVVNGPPAQEGTPLQHAANQLAVALATPTRDGSAGFNSETDRVLGIFDDTELITIDGDAPARSSVVVVIAGRPQNDKSPPGRDDAVRTVNEVVGALARQAAAVVAVAPTGGADDGSVLSSLRRDQNLATDVSSVDDADTPAGQAALVFAVLERLHSLTTTDGPRPAAGHYGEGPGADRALPDPADVS